MSESIRQKRLQLPPPRTEGPVSLESALTQRRSNRRFSTDALALDHLAQLLWAAQGMTSGGRRTAPSAGALYPLEVYVAAAAVSGLSPGIYRYRPRSHALEAGKPGDLREDLCDAALGQRSICTAPATIVISAVFERTTRKYGQRGFRYALMEAGHASQNVYLQAAALGLNTVAVGAFRDETVQRLLSMDADEEPLYLMPVGSP